MCVKWRDIFACLHGIGLGDADAATVRAMA